MAEQYIFDASAQSIFYERLNAFHDKYARYLLLNGVAQKGADLESIKMVKNPLAPPHYCRVVVGGFTRVRPNAVVKLTEGRATNLECIFTYLNNDKELNCVFMMQNVMNWPQLGKFSCQIWCLSEISVSTIKEHWG